ncbi:MAG: DUF1015 family protein [Vallitaleaceae bacterium]|jgi:uncharacterized protein (DUF1015 family)|nr:DUF1015 family protein [Vallitaleaceae bacterium]
MAKIKAFAGIRPNETMAKEIAALPYDVYNRTEAKAIVENNPLSFLKVDRAETQFDETIDTYDAVVYKKAQDLFNEMIEKGQLIQDQKTCLYIYRLTMKGRSQTGLVACTSIDEYIADIIKKHELTRAAKERDRINHVDSLDANTGPIFLTYRAKDAIDEIVNNWMENNPPIYDFVADDAIKHEMWCIDDVAIIESLETLFMTIPSLYIADGHHRAASAVKVGLLRREQHKDYTGAEEFNYFLSVIFPDNQLKIFDYNRVVKDLDGMTPEQFLGSVKESFDIIRTSKEQIKPTEKSTFGMFLEDTWYLIKAKEGTYRKEDPVLSLDVSVLQLNLLAPILGVGDPRTDERIDFVGGIRGLAELERRVKTDMMLAFALVPTSVDELMNIADAGELMPPKSTWFEPKLRSGLISHLLH